MLDDRQIKAMMHDAEEKVPSRVWSSVSSRLEAASEPTFSPVWKWAGIGFAFAALATGIFFVGTSDKSHEVAAPAQIAETVEIIRPEAGALEEQETALVADVVIPSPKKFVAFTATQDMSAEEPVSANDKPEAVAPDSASEEASVVVDKPIASTAPSADDTDAAQPDPFAALEKEQSRKTTVRRAQITFGGSVGGNRANGSGTSTMSSGTPTAPSTDVISETSTSSYGIPFSLGVGVRFNIAPKFYIGTGLDYSLLTRTFDGTFTAAGSLANVKGNVRNSLHYIGIPLRLFYNVIKNNDMKFYAYGGCEGEWCVSNRFDFHPTAGGDYIVKHIGVSSPQFSVGAGIGVQFKLADKVGLYLDPGINYYFYTSQPKSIRTDRPLMFNLNVGVRFEL